MRGPAAARPPPGAIERLLGAPDVEHVHPRGTTAGCLRCRLERAAA